MILNVKATPPTPPARQQANRLQLAEDLRSGRYRQEKTSFQSSDGSRVCLLGAAYETARRVQAYGQTMPTLENALANERRFPASATRNRNRRRRRLRIHQPATGETDVQKPHRLLVRTTG